MENLIKTISPVNCPHCNKVIMVEFNNIAPVLASVYGESDVLTAKADVLIALDGLMIPEEKKDMLKKWVNDPETVFGPSEVQAIIDNAKKDQE